MAGDLLYSEAYEVLKKGREQGREEGREQGREEGREEGLAEGRAQKAEEDAQLFAKAFGFSLDQVRAVLQESKLPYDAQ